MKILPIAILCGLVFGAAGMLSAIWAVLSAIRGEVLTALASAGFSMFCVGFIAPFVKVVPGRVRPRCEFDESGTTIRPDRGVDVPIQIALAGLCIGGGLFALLAPLGRLDIPVPREMRFYLPFVAGVAAALGGVTVWRTFRRGSSKYLHLTPRGFTIAQGWREQSAEWNDVKDVTDSVPGQPTSSSGAVVFVISDDDCLSISAASITPGGHALRQFVGFYWQHPANRAELVDGEAVRGLADGRFDADVK